MTETRKKYSLLEQEYTTFIQNLIATAVAAPIESYRKSTLGELAQATESLRAAADALRRHLNEAGGRMKSEFQPLADAVEEIGIKVDIFSSRAAESANGLHGTLASLSEALPAIPPQLAAQRTEAEKLRGEVAALRLRIDEQVQALVAELKRSGEGAAGAAVAAVKEAGTRLDARLAELAEAVAAAAEELGEALPRLRARLDEIGARGAEQVGHLEGLARRVEGAQAEAAAGRDAVLSGLTQVEQSLGRLVAEHVGAALTRLQEEQSNAERKVLEQLSALMAELKETAELIGLSIDEAEKRAGARAAEAGAQLGAQLTEAADALARSLADLDAAHALARQDVDELRVRVEGLAGALVQTHEQLASVQKTSGEQEARLASALKDSGKATEQRLQRLADELNKGLGSELTRQAEQARSQTARLQADLLRHVAELRGAIDSSADAVRQSLNNSLELSKGLAREGAQARTALENRLDYAVAEQQDIKRFIRFLSALTAFTGAGMAVVLLYLLFRSFA